MDIAATTGPAVVRDAGELVAALGLPPALREPARRAARSFGLLVPRSFLARMRPGDPSDPLLRQVLPAAEEELSGGVLDPVGDLAATAAPGMIRKYAGRALLVASPACAVHCRYCFRRHYPYAAAPRASRPGSAALRRIAEDPSIEEVILSGGDPLALDDEELSDLIGALEAIPHLRRLRIHTRFPIVVPERATGALARRLREGRLSPIVVVHANHPAEIAGDCAEALRSLVRSGIPTLNQSVLLRGVNDDPDALAELSLRLVGLGVLPYYLHQLDPVSGAMHFEVPVARGLEIVAELRARLPGYAVPRYVREVRGAQSKVPL